MPQKSWRHHYIPQFYLKNFTNAENTFHIYSVKKGNYKSNGKLFSPESHFFEIKGNTLITEQGSTDFLETDFYKTLDNDVAKLFYKIKNSTKERYGLSEEDMPMLQYFIANLYWRNPMNDGLVKQLLKTKGLSGLGFKFINTETKEIIINSDIEKKMIENESTYKMIKHRLPSVLYQNLFENDSPLTILHFIPPNDFPSLVSDNPLILRNPENIDVYRDDFILPLSRDKILIRTKKIKNQYQNRARVSIDCLLVRQANNFIATTDLKYIPLLQNVDKEKSNEEFRKEVFESFVDE
jgi:hypothetical protein